MINPYYFTGRNLTVGFKINLDSHNLHHTNSKLTILPNHPEFGIEVRYINKIRKNWQLFMLDYKININSNIKQYFQQDLISKMKMHNY